MTSEKNIIKLQKILAGMSLSTNFMDYIKIDILGGNGKCICGKDIIYNFHIKHKKTGTKLVLGSECIKNFTNEYDICIFCDKDTKNKSKICTNCNKILKNEKDFDKAIKIIKDGNVIYFNKCLITNIESYQFKDVIYQSGKYSYIITNGEKDIEVNVLDAKILSCKTKRCRYCNKKYNNLKYDKCYNCNKLIKVNNILDLMKYNGCSFKEAFKIIKSNINQLKQISL